MTVALLSHGHTEKACEARKAGLTAGAEAAESRRGEATTTAERAERTHEKVQRAAGVSEHKALPPSKCRLCRRPTATSVCGTCRAWHRYLSAIGSLREVTR